MKRFMQALLEMLPDSIEDPERKLDAYESAKDAAGIFCEQLLSNYVDGIDRTDRALRLSTLGKFSPVELAAYYFGKIKQTNRTSSRIKRLLIDGFIFEAQLYFELELMGYKVINNQFEVVWQGITGHPDFMVRTPEGEDWIIDAKTCNDFYFKRIVKHHVHDDRGYMTQLAAYSEAAGVPACLVFKNKNTSEIATFFLDGEIHRLQNMGDTSNSVVTISVPDPEYTDKVVDALYHAKEVNNFLTTCCAEWEDIFSKYTPPYPNVELYFEHAWSVEKGKYVRGLSLPVLDDFGRPKFYAPQSIAHPELMYVLEEGLTRYGKRRTYVKDYRYPEMYEHLKPDLYGSFDYDRFVESINAES